MGIIPTIISLLPLVAVLFAANQPAIAIKVTPLAGFSPLSIRVTTTLDPHAANRLLCVIVHSEDAVSYDSCHSVNGALAPRTAEEWFKDLTEGAYNVQAYVARENAPSKFTPPVSVIVR